MVHGFLNYIFFPLLINHILVSMDLKVTQKLNKFNEEIINM